MPVLCGIIFVIVLVAAVIACSKRARGFFVKLYKKVFGGHGIVRRMGEARFASAMAMGMMSGLNTEDAFRTAMLFQDVNQKTKKRYEKALRCWKWASRWRSHFGKMKCWKRRFAGF